MLHTLKLAHRVPAKRNREDVIQRRDDYAHGFLEEANSHYPVSHSPVTYEHQEARGVLDEATSLPLGLWAERTIHYNMFGKTSGVLVDQSHDLIKGHDRGTFQRVFAERKKKKFKVD